MEAQEGQRHALAFATPSKDDVAKVRCQCSVAHRFFGVSAAYFQAGLFLNGSGTLTTIEGDPGLASLARENLGRRDPHRVEVIVGRFQDKLAPTLNRIGKVDMAFFDGHHEYAPTMEYFETMRTSMAEKNCVVLDDLYPWMFPLRRAWLEISRAGDVEAFDTGKLGILMKGWEEGQGTGSSAGIGIV